MLVYVDEQSAPPTRRRSSSSKASQNKKRPSVIPKLRRSSASIESIGAIESAGGSGRNPKRTSFVNSTVGVDLESLAFDVNDDNDNTMIPLPQPKLVVMESLAETADISSSSFLLDKDESSDGRPDKYSRKTSAESDKTVRFSSIKIHYHGMILGDNPAVLNGPPIQIEWESQDETCTTVDEFEHERESKPECKRKTMQQLKIPRGRRIRALRKAGYVQRDFLLAEMQLQKLRAVSEADAPTRPRPETAPHRIRATPVKKTTTTAAGAGAARKPGSGAKISGRSGSTTTGGSTHRTQGYKAPKIFNLFRKNNKSRHHHAATTTSTTNEDDNVEAAAAAVTMTA